MPESAGFSFDPEVGPDWWTMAPTRLLRARGLSPIGKVLYLVLCSYAMQHTDAWPGQERLAEDCDVSRPTLRSALRELIAVGLVEQRRRGQGLTNLYHLHKVPIESVREGKNLAFSPEAKNLANRKANTLPPRTQESAPKEDVSQEQTHKNGSDARHIGQENALRNQRRREGVPDAYIDRELTVYRASGWPPLPGWLKPLVYPDP